MTTFQTSAGYEREAIPRPSTEQLIQDNAERYGISRDEAIEWLAEVNWPHFQDETPMTNDLSDFSIHNPSGKGRKEGDVMSEHVKDCECPACGALRVFRDEYQKGLAANPRPLAPRYISVGWVTILASGAIYFAKYELFARLRAIGKDREVRECFVRDVEAGSGEEV
jgi:hypothetical protein